MVDAWLRGRRCWIGSGVWPVQRRVTFSVIAPRPSADLKLPPLVVVLNRVLCGLPYLLGAASLAGVQLLWISPVAHSPGPFSRFWVGSRPSASCPVMIVSVAVPCRVVTVAVTVTPPSPGSVSTTMGGAALAEVVAAVTTNRAPTKERMILLISAP